MSLNNSYAHAETHTDRVHGEAERSSITGRLPPLPKLCVTTERAVTEREQIAAAGYLDQSASDELQDAIDAEHEAAEAEHEHAMAAHYAEQERCIEQHPELQRFFFHQMQAMQLQCNQIASLAKATPSAVTSPSAPDLLRYDTPTDLIANFVSASQVMTRELLKLYGIEYKPLVILGRTGQHLQRRHLHGVNDGICITEPVPGLRPEDSDLPIRTRESR